MITIKKRILSAVLAVSALGLMMPAKNGNISDSVSITASAYSEGTYGNLTYSSYDSDGDSDYDYIEISDCDDLAVSVDIPAVIDGLPVTNIGDGAFLGCVNLKSVTIPEGIVNIEGYAFSECESLTSVVVPDSVLSIGNGAFNGCINLQNVVIGDGVTNIGYEAFRKCSGLKSITLGAGISELDRIPYEQDGISEINVSESNTVYSSEDGVLYNKDKTELIRFPQAMSSDNFAIPDSVTDIAENAFSGCSGLTGVTMGNGITELNDDLFVDCPLEYLFTGNSVESINEDEFSGFESLSDIELGSGLKRICTGAFSDTAWYDAQPDGILYLGDWCMGYKNNFAEKNVVFDDGTKGIADYAFDYSDIETAVFPESMKYVGNLVFSNSSLSEITMNDGLEEIGEYAFYSCKELIFADIPDAVTYIGQNAFEDCNNLLSVSIPENLTSVGYNAFFGCDKLKSVVIPPSAEEIGEKSIGYSSDGKTIEGFKIYGISGTEAEVYANANNITFIDIDNTVMISDTELDLTEGEIILLTVKNYNGNIKWISDDNMIASVDENGYVYALSEGEATIYAIAGDDMFSCKVNVQKTGIITSAVTTVTTTSATTVIKTTTTAKTQTSQTTTSSKTTTTFITTATSLLTTTISTVKSSAISTNASTTISTDLSTVISTTQTTETSGAVTKLPDKQFTINAGDEIYLNVKNYDGEVVWATENSAVATVTDGKVRGISDGTVVIYAITENGTVSCLVRVVGNCGDADGDGVLTARDAAFIARKIVEGKVNELPMSADFSNDGKISAYDCACIVKRLASRIIKIEFSIVVK